MVIYVLLLCQDSDDDFQDAVDDEEEVSVSDVAAKVTWTGLAVLLGCWGELRNERKSKRNGGQRTSKCLIISVVV